MTNPDDPFAPPGEGGGEPVAPPPRQDQPPGYAPPPGYGPPPGWGALPTQTNSRAVIALVLSIVSFMICPVIPAIVALVLIPGARAEIAASGGRQSGEGLITAAKIISWINIGGFVALVIGGVALLAVFSSNSTY